MAGILQRLAENEQADHILKTSTFANIEFNNNKLKKINGGENYEEVLRLIKNGRMGRVVSTKAGIENQLIDMARAAVAYGNQIDYTMPGQATTQPVNIMDEEIKRLKEDYIIEKAQTFISKAKDLHDSIQTTVKFKKETGYRHLTNTSGFNDSFNYTQIECIIGLSLIEGKNILETYEFINIHRLHNLNWEKITSKLLNDIQLGRQNTTMDSRTYPVIFTPNAVVDLMYPIMACLNGRAVTQGLSPWRNRMGEALFHPDINIFNDGLLDWGPGSRPFDREGVPCKRFPLIEAGRLQQFLLDLDTAHQLGLEPCGTGGDDGPRANNIIFAAGKTDYNDMVKDIKKGVIIDQTMGAWAGNPYGGQVSGTISLGYRIENGKPDGRIKDAMFSVNVFKALKDKIGAVSKEQYWCRNFLLPYILLHDVNISMK